MKRIVFSLVSVFCGLVLTACNYQPSSSDIQRDRQETQVREGIAEVGIPAIKNFRMLKLLKDIEEMQDQEGLVTYTYVENMVPTVVHGHTTRGGKFTFFCDSFGYPIPYATQFSAPESMQRYHLPAGKGTGQTLTYGVTRLPQTEPNGLFMPASADGTWVVCKDPESDKVGVIYSEPKLATFPFKLKLD